MNLRCEKYNNSHLELMNRYFAEASEEAPNNSSAKKIRLSSYDDEQGALFLVLNESDEIIAMSSVILSEEVGGPAAKIYGRFHIKKNSPHSVIDQFIEPESFKWIAEKGVKNVFLTVNLGHERTLAWVSGRCGTRKGMNRPNPYGSRVGHEIRSGWKYHPKLILERHTWQYCIYYSPSGDFFLEREERDIGNDAKAIFEKNF